MTGFVLGVTGFYLVLPSFTDFHAQTHRRATIASALEELKAIVRKFPAKRQKKKNVHFLSNGAVFIVTGFYFYLPSFRWSGDGPTEKENKTDAEWNQRKNWKRINCVCVFLFLGWFSFWISFRSFFLCVFSTFFTHFPSGAHFPSARPSRRGAAAPTAPTRRIISFHLPLIHFTTLIHSRPNPVKTQESPGKPDKTRLSPSRPSKIRLN